MSEAISGADNWSDAKISRAPSAFGDVVRRLREERGLTQTMLAAKMSQSVSYVSLVESGRRKPTPKVLGSVIDALAASKAEEAELRVAAGLPTSPLDTAIQHCIAALEEVAGLDAFDRYLARRDLTSILNAWKGTFHGKREMESGAFEAAHASFKAVAQNRELTPLLQANAYAYLADVQEKQGSLKDAQDSIRKAQITVQPLDSDWQRPLRGEINGILGFFAARAGESHLAEVLAKQGLRDYESLRDSENNAGKDPETMIIVKIGIANALSRLALKALFAGDSDLGTSYAQNGQHELPAAPQRDIERTRLRLVALEALAYAQKGEFTAARLLREAVLREYTAMQDKYGIAKSLAYMADDSRMQLTAMLGDDSSRAVTPEERTQRVTTLRMGPDIEQFIPLLTHAIDTYREAIDGLKTVGDRILLARCWRNLGDMLHCRWLLYGRIEDLDESASRLDTAYTIEKDMSAGQTNKGRRFVSVCESQAKLAWDEGVLTRALDKYLEARKALSSHQMTSSDPAGEAQRARIDEAIQIIQSRIGITTRSQERGTKAERSDKTAHRPAHEPGIHGMESEANASAERMWRMAQERIEQLTLPKIADLLGHSDGFSAMSESSVQWARSLYELEREEGPRFLAQRSPSSFLSGNMPLTSSREAQNWRKEREERIRANVKQARETGGRVCYVDICSTADFELANQSSLKRSPASEGFSQSNARYEQAITFLRDEGDIYRLHAIPYDIPIAFAIKGNVLLIKMSTQLAVDQNFISTPDGDFACFRIEGDADLIHELSDVFASLLEMARLTEQDGQSAVDVLEGQWGVGQQGDTAAPAVHGSTDL